MRFDALFRPGCGVASQLIRPRRTPRRLAYLRTTSWCLLFYLALEMCAIGTLRRHRRLASTPTGNIGTFAGESVDAEALGRSSAEAKSKKKRNSYMMNRINELFRRTKSTAEERAPHPYRKERKSKFSTSFAQYHRRGSEHRHLISDEDVKTSTSTGKKEIEHPNSKVDESLYSRQLYVLGHRAQKSLSR